LVGGQFSAISGGSGNSTFLGLPEGEVCGAVMSIRYSEDILSVWNKTAGDKERVDRLRDAIKRVLQLPNFVHMEYKPHETSLQDKSSFRNTHVWKPKSASLVEREGGGGARKASWGEREEMRGGSGGSGKSSSLANKSRDTERSWR